MRQSNSDTARSHAPTWLPLAAAPNRQFNFDEALDENVTNDQVYRTTVQPLVCTLFANGKATCFAYGQTGSGKTYTMSPLPIRAAADILQYLARPEYGDVSLFVSCFEIYGNKVRCGALLRQPACAAILNTRGRAQSCPLSRRFALSTQRRAPCMLHSWPTSSGV